MHTVKEISESRRLYTSPEGVVSASENDLWLPALFDSEETALLCFDAPNAVLSYLQQQANTRRGVVTLLDLFIGPHLWFPAGHIVPRWVQDVTRSKRRGQLWVPVNGRAKRHRTTFEHDVWVVPRGDRVLVLDPSVAGPTILVNLPGEDVFVKGGRGFKKGCWFYGGPPRQIIDTLIKDGLLQSSNVAWHFAKLALARFSSSQKDRDQ